jgi:transcriptional regulator with XRE-family HTH domain
MFSERIGRLLKNARRQLDLSREELARRGGVSTRLVAELERGQRPNVSLESALKLLNAVGVSVVARAPHGATAEIRGESAATLERAARAARRRQAWTGRHILLHDEGGDPRPRGSKAKQLASVAQVSRQAHAIASAGRNHVGRKAPRHSAR